jgi:phenylacetate-CoA ligase
VSGGEGGPVCPADAVGGRFWDADGEQMSLDELRQTQLRRLQATLRLAHDRLPAWRRRLAELHIAPEDVDCHGDAQDLGFTSPADLREGHPFGTLVVPREEVVLARAAASDAGSLVTTWSKTDIEVERGLAARALAAGGVRRGDIVLDAAGAGPPGGFDVAGAAGLLGAAVLRTVDDPAHELALMRDLGVAALVCTSAHARALACAAEDGAVERGRLACRTVFHSGGPWSDDERRRVEAALGGAALRLYLPDEMGAPPVAFECLARDGLHVNEDHYLTEVVDARTSSTVFEGEVGELVITTLSRQAQPLIRYRTGDPGSIVYGPCVCGRLFARISLAAELPVAGRVATDER